VVLSRPQVLAADVVVLAEVEDRRKPVVVKRVLTPRADIKEGEELEVVNLDKVDTDWEGPGSYILPLRGTGQQGRYAVAPIPTSPGYDEPGPPRIYPDKFETRAQLQQIRDE
jgi:hypothetical protein